MPPTGSRSASAPGAMRNCSRRPRPASCAPGPTRRAVPLPRLPGRLHTEPLLESVITFVRGLEAAQRTGTVEHVRRLCAGSDSLLQRLTPPVRTAAEKTLAEARAWPATHEEYQRRLFAELEAAVRERRAWDVRSRLQQAAALTRRGASASEQHVLAAARAYLRGQDHVTEPRATAAYRREVHHRPVTPAPKKPRPAAQQKRKKATPLIPRTVQRSCPGSARRSLSPHRSRPGSAPGERSPGGPGPVGGGGVPLPAQPREVGNQTVRGAARLAPRLPAHLLGQAPLQLLKACRQADGAGRFRPDGCPARLSGGRRGRSWSPRWPARPSRWSSASLVGAQNQAKAVYTSWESPYGRSCSGHRSNPSCDQPRADCVSGGQRK